MSPVRHPAFRLSQGFTVDLSRAAPPPDQVREQAAELPTQGYVAVGPGDESDLAVRPEPGPRPPARQVEGDREAEDEAQEAAGIFRTISSGGVAGT